MNQNVSLRHYFSKDASSTIYRAAYDCGCYCGYSAGFMGVTWAAVQDLSPPEGPCAGLDALLLLP